MNQKALEILDFEEVQTILARETLTPMGRDLVMSARPCPAAEVRERQAMVAEMSRALGLFSFSYLSGIPDPRPVVEKVSAGGVLSAAELGVALQALSAMESTRSWALGLNPEEFPNLRAAGERIPRLKDTVQFLETTVTPEGDIKDSASDLLRRIRREMRKKMEEMRARLESLCRSPQMAKYLQEPVVTVRGGRYVLPVKQEHASRVPGVIHDQSGSGQTVFIEPMVAVEMWNELRKVELAERDEIERILREATDLLRGIPGLRDGVRSIGEIDFALARAVLMDKWHGVLPEVTDAHEIVLRRARHPLIRGQPVPLDVALGSPQESPRTLVITGPNMGGKTVALKTIGLLTALALSGLPVPADRGTVVGDFSDILVDIGDEQSIEENLSTFSAHIRNMIAILDQAAPGKLVLIDELGAGTDPLEGAALGMAVLKRLHSKGAITVVSTHYSEIKTLAHETEGMENASMEWDAVNLVPTYRLLVGRPGRSNALDVALRIGLSPDIVNEARDFMPGGMVRLEDLIREMERKTRETEEELARLKKESALYEKLRVEMETQVESCAREKREILARARREATEIVRTARVEAESLIKEARKALRDSDTAEAVLRVRRGLEVLEKDIDERVPGVAEEEFVPAPAAQILPGACVRVRGLTGPGHVLELPDDSGNVLVQIGSVIMKVKSSDISTVPGEGEESSFPAARPQRERAAVSPEKASHVRSEIDLRGVRVPEALATLDKYLDDAYLAGLRTVRIIHGKGTGVLRRAVIEFLREHPHVKDTRTGELAEGGSGVTVALLRE